MTRWWSIAVLAVGSISGCSRPNPDFEQETAATRADADGDGPDTGAQATSSMLPTSGADASSGVTSDGEPTSQGGDGADSTTSAEESGSESGAPPLQACMFPPPYHVDLGAANPTEKCEGIATVGIFPAEVVDESFMATVCETGCICKPGEGVDTTVMFQGPVPSVAPGCFILEVQRTAACEVRAYAASDFGTLLTVASNVVDPMLEEPFDFTLGDQITACDSSCESSGYRDLQTRIPEAPTVPPNEPTMVEVGMSTYRVVNEGSGTDATVANDGTCRDVGRWHASWVPM